MATTPTGNWSTSLDRVRDHLANVSAFRDWITPPNASQVSVAIAKSRIHLYEKKRNGLAWPFVVIKQKNITFGNRANAVWTGVENEECDLDFEMKITETVGTPDEVYQFTNPVGLILEGFLGMYDTTNTIEVLYNAAFRLVDTPHWVSEGEQVTEGGIMRCTFNLIWG
jgi:hypothetical protein